MNWRTSSCCCFSLRTGTLILGWLGVISSALASVGILAFLVQARKIVEEYTEVPDKKAELTPEDVDSIVRIVQIILSIVLALCLLQLVLSILLLLGVYKEKPKYIWINVVVGIIHCVLILLSIIICIIGSFANPQLLGNVISQAISLAIQVYFTMVIHSYRLELIEASNIKRGTTMQQHF